MKTATQKIRELKHRMLQAPLPLKMGDFASFVAQNENYTGFVKDSYAFRALKSLRNSGAIKVKNLGRYTAVYKRGQEEPRKGDFSDRVYRRRRVRGKKVDSTPSVERGMTTHEFNNKFVKLINEFFASQKKVMQKEVSVDPQKIEQLEGEVTYYKQLCKDYKAKIDNLEAKSQIRF
jgi:hypothetical protein